MVQFGLTQIGDYGAFIFLSALAMYRRRTRMLNNPKQKKFSGTLLGGAPPPTPHLFPKRLATPHLSLSSRQRTALSLMLTTVPRFRFDDVIYSRHSGDDGSALLTALTKCDSYSWCNEIETYNATMTTESLGMPHATMSHGWGTCLHYTIVLYYI